MAAQTPSQIPATIRAGATLSFQISLADYSAAGGWAITYAFRGTGLSQINFTTTASGTDHLANVSFSDTSGWLPGTYTGVGIVSDGATKTEIWRGSLTVLPDIASAEQGKDFRSQARRTLDNINAVIEGRANSTILNSSVEGTTLGRIPYEQLRQLRIDYEVKVANEERAEAGKSARRMVYAAFTRPT